MYYCMLKFQTTRINNKAWNIMTSLGRTAEDGPINLVLGPMNYYSYQTKQKRKKMKFFQLNYKKKKKQFKSKMYNNKTIVS